MFIQFDSFHGLISPHILTSSLTFIVLSIQLTIVGNREVRAFVCFDWIQISNDLTHSIFLMHSHSYFITHIHCFVYLTEHFWDQRGKCIFLFLLNKSFVRLDSLNIFDALTRIDNHSHSLFPPHHQEQLGKSNCLFQLNTMFVQF